MFQQPSGFENELNTNCGKAKQNIKKFKLSANVKQQVTSTEKKTYWNVILSQRESGPGAEAWAVVGRIKHGRYISEDDVENI